MATNTLVPTGGTLTFGGGTNFNCQVISCRIQEVPPRRDEVETMCGVSISYGQTRYEMVLNYVQDWATGGISAYLWDNSGTNAAFVYKPTNNTAPSMSGTVTIRAGAQGDAAGRIATDTVTMDCVGKPTRG